MGKDSLGLNPFQVVLLLGVLIIAVAAVNYSFFEFPKRTELAAKSVENNSKAIKNNSEFLVLKEEFLDKCLGNLDASFNKEFIATGMDSDTTRFILAKIDNCISRYK